eukprot:382410_1
MSDIPLHRTETGLLTKQNNESYGDYLSRMCCCISFITFLAIVLFGTMSMLWHFEIKGENYNSSYCTMEKLEIINCCIHNNCYDPKKYVYIFAPNATYCNQTNNTFHVSDTCQSSQSKLGKPKYYINQTMKCYNKDNNCNSFSLTNKESEDKKTLRHWIALTIVASSLCVVIWIIVLIIYCNTKLMFKNRNMDYSPRQQRRQNLLRNIESNNECKLQK